MANHKNPELERSQLAFRALAPLVRYRYGDFVLHHFPTIDLYKLGQAKAGRVVYDEGLEALRMITKLYPRRPRPTAPAATVSASQGV